MPGVHASHKGASVKPNTNANGVIDDASNPGVDPEALLEQPEGYPFDAQGQAEEETNPAALERGPSLSEDDK